MGVKFSQAAAPLPWRLFSGALHDTREGQVRVLGESIDPWLDPPSP